MTMSEHDVILHQTQSVCPECLRRIDAAYRLAPDGGIFLHKRCPQHGDFRTPVWRQGQGLPDFRDWVTERVPAPPQQPGHAADKGCPYDCGLCPDHAQHTCTGLIEVTRRCNMACPVCYASADRDDAGDLPLDEALARLRGLRAVSGACNVQFSGGEPTLYERLPQLVAAARDLGFGLLQVNSNGLRLAEEDGYARRLREAGLDSVYLQWDGPDDAVFRKLRGRDCLAFKRQALRRCAEAGLGVVLVCTLARGVNDHLVGDLLRRAVRLGPAVRGLHFQPAASFGRVPWALDQSPRLPLPDLMLALERQSDGMVRARHFHAPSCEHSLCSFSAVYAREGEGLSAEPVGATCCGGSGARLDNAEGARRSRAFVAGHWGAPQPTPDAADAFSRFLNASGADRRFTVSAMAFQDALSFDVERIRGCCIHVVVGPGKLIPFCAYNLTAHNGQPLYRGRAS